MKPEVSVILAVFNENKYLPGCLKSLSRQRGVDFEVIVVDDGSTFKLPIADNQFVDKNKCRVFKIKHSGPAKARNFGAKKAKGKILVFVDGDMKFTSRFLAQLTLPIRKGKAKGTFSTDEIVANWDKVYARCWNWENGIVNNRRINPKRLDMVKDFRAILKSEFLKVNGFDDIGYTDTWSLTEKLSYMPKPVEKAVYYHYNPENLLEIFRQAVWIGGKKRKYGWIGKIAAIFRATMPMSIVFGLIKAIKYREINFLKFKIIYDLGIFTGGIANF